jgi:LacI family transcriptional regulator
MRGMQAALAESEFDLLVYTGPKPEEIDGQLERAAQRGRSEGLLLLSTPLTEERVRQLKASRRPIVLVDAAHPDFDSVSVDNVKGGYMATRHLLDEGYRRIGLVTVTPEPIPAAQRRQGYEQALREAGCAVEPCLVGASERRPYGFVEEAGYEAMQPLLRRQGRPDAVFVVSDIQALGVLHALQEAGLSAPDDMGVIGFDGLEIGKYVGLSTLQQPMFEMGRLAIEKLLMRIRHPEHPTSHTVFSPVLLCRSTCARAGRSLASRLSEPAAEDN